MARFFQLVEDFPQRPAAGTSLQRLIAETLDNHDHNSEIASIHAVIVIGGAMTHIKDNRLKFGIRKTRLVFPKWHELCCLANHSISSCKACIAIYF